MKIVKIPELMGSSVAEFLQVYEVMWTSTHEFIVFLRLTPLSLQFFKGKYNDKDRTNKWMDKQIHKYIATPAQKKNKCQQEVYTKEKKSTL